MKRTANKEVELGSVVRIQSSIDSQSFMLVESQDADPFMYRISVDSPMGRALLHKHEHDIVHVEGPRLRDTYEILSIQPGSMAQRFEGTYAH